MDHKDQEDQERISTRFDTIHNSTTTERPKAQDSLKRRGEKIFGHGE